MDLKVEITGQKFTLSVIMILYLTDMILWVVMLVIW